MSQGEKAGSATSGSTAQGPRRPSALLNRIPSRSLTNGSIGSVGLAEEDEALLQSLDTADDVSEWLNEALDVRIARRVDTTDVSGANDEKRNGSSKTGLNALINIDTQLSHLSTMLSIARQDTLSSMDTTMATVSSAIPRLGVELRLMRDAAATLKANIERLRQETESVGIRAPAQGEQQHSSQQATAVLQRLAALSALHDRMTAARDVLSLAESWSTLSTDVTACLADGKFQVAAARLSKAKSSLAVFERTPEYESRKKLLDSLGNALEGRMAPTLVDAVRDRDVEQAQKLFGVFATIDRQARFAELWRQIRSEGCLTDWSRVGEGIGAAEGNSAASVAMSLRRFADELIKLLNEESRIVGQIIPTSPRENVEKIASSVLASLEPSMKRKLAVMMDRKQPHAVLLAIESHRSLRYAAIGMAASIAKCESSSSSPVRPPDSPVTLKVTGTQKNHSAQSPEATLRLTGLPANNGTQARRLSTRRLSSIGLPRSAASSAPEASNELGASNLDERFTQLDSVLSAIPMPTDWETKLFEPLLEYQLDYEVLERVYISHTLQASLKQQTTTARPDQSDSAWSDVLLGKDLISDLKVEISQAIEIADAAAQRTLSLTYGLGCDGMVACMDDALSSILSRNKEKVGQRTSGALEAAQRAASDKAEGGQARSDGLLGAGHVSSSAEGIEWKAFEEGMALLANLRDISEQIQSVEASTAERMLDLADFLLASPSAATNEALKRLCSGEASETCTASFRLLLQASADRIRTGNLTAMLRRIRTIATRSRKPASVAHLTLFHSARSAILDQVRTLQRHLTNVILSPLMPHMEVYAALPIWSSSRLPGSVNEYDLTMPTFSLSPTEDMSRIGEALLDLPRLLEVWSELPQFRWSVQGLAFAPASAKDIFVDDMPLETPVGNESAMDLFETATPSPKREKRLSLHGAGSASPTAERRTLSGTHRHTPSVASIATLPARGEQTKKQDGQASVSGGDSAQSALQSYLTSISLTLVSHLVSLVLPSIAHLTGPGASQLAADLEYLLTILSALNVSQQSPNSASEFDDPSVAGNDEVLLLIRSLEAWKDVCRIKDPEGRRLRHLLRTGQVARGGSLGEAIADFEGDEDKLRSLLGTQAFDMIARMRGW